RSSSRRVAQTLARSGPPPAGRRKTRGRRPSRLESARAEPKQPGPRLTRRGSPAGCCRERGLQRLQLARLPGLEGGGGGGERLGDRRDLDALLAGGIGDPFHVGGAVLAVVDPHLDLPARDLAVDRRLVFGGRLGAF